MKEYFLWLSKLITLLLIFFIGLPLLLGALAATAMSFRPDGIKIAGDRVAVVELNGMIDSSREIIEKLTAQIEDKSVKGIILRINSPGGAVAPSQEIYRAVKNLKNKKPIVASMGSLAASGGLYSALGASKVFAEPGTLTGSIGVIAQFPNLSKLSDRVGIDVITVKSGALKDVGNSFRPMTPEEQEFLESTIGEVHRQFVVDVQESRGLSAEAIAQFADGRVLLGSQAKEIGLVDEFGGVLEAARAVFELAGEPLAEDQMPKLFYPEDQFKELRRLLSSGVRYISGDSSRLQLMYLMP